MPLEAIAVLVFVTLLFLVFMGGLYWAERQTRQFRS